MTSTQTDKTCMLVVTHKEATFPEDEMFKPIMVGPKEFTLEGAWRDDTLDNIAHKNPNFSELTALYWFWKNELKNYDIVGLCHYRRYFTKHPLKEGHEYFLTEADIKSYLDEADIILPDKYYWLKDNPVASNYSRGAGVAKDLELLKQVVGELTPEYSPALDKVLNSHSASYYNMFIMRSKDLDRYCEWLFKILFALEDRIDLTGYSSMEKRVFGYLSEIMLNVWAEKEKLKIKTAPMVLIGSKLKKYYNFFWSYRPKLG